MTVCRLRSGFLALCALELVLTSERQVFDFLGYMWAPILANFLNVLFLIFGCFGAVQDVSKYLYTYAGWSAVWLAWNSFLICFFLNVGSLRRESELLSLGTGGVSWWEHSGWGCRPVWGADGGEGAWLRPARVDGCALPWPRVELAQAVVSLALSGLALPPALMLGRRGTRTKPKEKKESASRRPIYTVELSSSLVGGGGGAGEGPAKPMTPRRVKRRSGSRSHNSSVRRSRRSYRNAAFLASSASLPRPPRPPSAHSSYSNFHGARPASYHAEPPASYHAEPSASYHPEPPSSFHAEPPDRPQRGLDSARYEPTASVSCYDSTARLTTSLEPPYVSQSYLGEGAWEAPPPPAPPYCARATPQAPGPPAYRASPDTYM